MAASQSGTVVLTAHSWTDGDSLGSKLLSARVGDRLTISSGRNIACYSVTSAESVTPERYAQIMVERQLTMPTEGPPKGVIIVCDDYDPQSKEWRKRRLIFVAPLE
jgi:LPXTG-site transpeptidase (sortase) family protein